MTEKAFAPWTEQQVFKLKLRQLDFGSHSYTCNEGHDLQPTLTGLKCYLCNFNQEWCHAADLTHPYSTIGLAPNVRLSLMESEHECQNRTKSLISRLVDDSSYSSLRFLLDRLAIYEPRLDKVLPWKTKP